MSELFDEEVEKSLVIDSTDEIEEEVSLNLKSESSFDARRRLERLLEEKRLRDELEDFLDD